MWPVEPPVTLRQPQHPLDPQQPVQPTQDLPLRNRLGQSRSPYVSWVPRLMQSSMRQMLSKDPVADVVGLAIQVRDHAYNPVAWQVWELATIELAQRLNRPIFVSIGYAASHCA